MRIDLTLVPDSGVPRDVVISTPRGAVVRDVRASLCALAGCAPGTALWIAGERLDDDLPLGTPPFMPGVVIALGARPQPPAARRSLLVLRVIGGSDAGRCIDLPAGDVVIGRAADCDLVLSDPSVSRHHVRLSVTAQGVCVTDLGASNPAAIDGILVAAGGARLVTGAVLHVGDTFLTLSGLPDLPAATIASEGSVQITRRPHVAAPSRTQEFVMPAEPEPPPGLLAPLAPAVITAVTGLAFALMLRDIKLVILAVVAPLGFAALTGAEQLTRRRAARRAADEAHRRIRAIEDTVRAAVRDETARLRHNYPDVASIVEIAQRRTVRLWQRSPADDDFLTVRVGTGDIASEITVRSDGEATHPGLHAVPVVVDLTVGPTYLRGPRAVTERLAAFMICQLASLCAPAELEIIGVFTPERAADWHWLRWLPHLTSPPSITDAEHGRLVRRLTAMLPRHGDESDRRTGSWIVLVVDGPDHLVDSMTAASGVSALVLGCATGPRGGVSTVDVIGPAGTRLHVHRDESAVECAADLMTTDIAETVARTLTPVTESRSGSTGLPRECALLALLDHPDAPAIIERWAAHSGHPTTAIGVGALGAVQLDLVRDGPHVLVAGTTGSGKSEFLQTLVVGLAANSPPEMINFVLVDYKGGAAFACCQQLPHVAGLVTDLQPAMTQRALLAFAYELQTREALFAQHGASDLDAYNAAAPASRRPRLVIIVDEFAALAEQAPDFLRGLVAVSQRGRSLGVHLILATQRPAGVVSAEIRANASLRVALRVIDTTESLDLVGSAQAAEIDPSLQGRAIVTTSSGTAEVQLARVSGRSDAPPTRPVVERMGEWRARPLADRCPPTAAGSPVDDLSVLVAAISTAAQRSHRPRADSPWRPPLPAHLSTGQLPPPPRPTLLHIGLVDQPHCQAQPTLALDLAAGGTTIVAGAARSGRTTTARTIADLATSQLPEPELTVITISAGPDGFVTRANDAALHINDFEAVRRAVLDVQADLTARRPSAALRLLVIDGWDEFTCASQSTDHGATVDTLLDIARRAGSAQLTVIVTGDRSAFSPRLVGTATNTFALRLADPADLALVGIDRRRLPASMGPGRALTAPTGDEVQFAVHPMCGYR